MKEYDKVAFFGSLGFQIDMVWSLSVEESQQGLEWNVWLLFQRKQWIQIPTPITFKKRPTQRQLRAAMIRHVKAWCKGFLSELPRMTMHASTYDDTWQTMNDIARLTDK